MSAKPRRRGDLVLLIAVLVAGVLLVAMSARGIAQGDGDGSCGSSLCVPAPEGARP